MSVRKMRTLKYAILGLLNQKEMSGYDLMKQFESTLCEFWTAKHSQIYPELKKLTEEGRVTYKTETSETNSEKKFITSPMPAAKTFSNGSLQKRRRSRHRRMSPASKFSSATAWPPQIENSCWRTSCTSIAPA